MAQGAITVECSKTKSSAIKGSPSACRWSSMRAFVATVHPVSYGTGNKTLAFGHHPFNSVVYLVLPRMRNTIVDNLLQGLLQLSYLFKVVNAYNGKVRHIGG